MTLETFDPLRVVAALRAAEVRHVLIGDLAAMAHGAPLEPDRVEICLPGDDSNVAKLGLCLEALAARPDAATEDEHRAVFATAAGPVECVELPTLEEYDAFELRAREVELGEGVRAKVAPPVEETLELRDTDDLVAAVRAASFEEEDDREVPAFLRPDPEGDEFGPDPEVERAPPWRRVWKAFEDVDRFLTDLTQGKARTR
jgi:hypothetical protein